MNRPGIKCLDGYFQYYLSFVLYLLSLAGVRLLEIWTAKASLHVAGKSLDVPDDKLAKIGKKLLAGFQLDEKFWVGIEKIIDDVIIFHKYARPDMPGHNGIIVVGINEKKILWQNI